MSLPLFWLETVVEKMYSALNCPKNPGYVPTAGVWASSWGGEGGLKVWTCLPQAEQLVLSDLLSWLVNSRKGLKELERWCFFWDGIREDWTSHEGIVQPGGCHALLGVSVTGVLGQLCDSYHVVSGKELPGGAAASSGLGLTQWSQKWSLHSWLLKMPEQQTGKEEVSKDQKVGGERWQGAACFVFLNRQLSAFNVLRNLEN